MQSLFRACARRPPITALYHDLSSLISLRTCPYVALVVIHVIAVLLLQPTSSTANKPVICSYFFRLNMQHFNLIVPVIVGSVKTFGDEVFR